MYRFTNGLILYTKEEADKAIKAGYKLIEKQIEIDEMIDEIDKIADKSISESNSEFKKTTRKNKTSI